MKHFLQQTVKLFKYLGMDSEGNKRWDTEAIMVQARLAPADETIQETGGEVRIVSARLWLKGERSLVRHDAIECNGKLYLVERIREKIDKKGKVLFKTAQLSDNAI